MEKRGTAIVITKLARKSQEGRWENMRDTGERGHFPNTNQERDRKGVRDTGSSLVLWMKMMCVTLCSDKFFMCTRAVKTLTTSLVRTWDGEFRGHEGKDL